MASKPKFVHKFKYQQPVKYKNQLAYIESSILGDKYHYQVRIHETMTLYNCEERELEAADPGNEMLYDKP